MSPPAAAQILTLQCRDRAGIVATVTTRIHAHGGNITEAQQFNDPDTGEFFMRVAFDVAGGELVDALRRDLEPVVHDFGMTWQVRPGAGAQEGTHPRLAAGPLPA